MENLFSIKEELCLDKNNIKDNEEIEAFCFNCGKGFGVEDGGFFIVDETYCSLECLVEQIVKNIEREISFKKLKKEEISLEYLKGNYANEAFSHLNRHYGLDENKKKIIINKIHELHADYLLALLLEY